MDESDIDFSRGDDEIVFVDIEDIDPSEIIEEAEDPRKRLEKELSRKGLEWENARIAAIFRDEISLHMKENAKITLNDDQIYPGR